MHPAQRAILAVAHPGPVAEAAAAGWPDDMPADPFLCAHLIGQAAHETGGFRRAEENLAYSAERLRQVFGFYARNPALAEAHAYVPELIASHAYARRILGNGPPETGDGWRYRGRGPLQLTGRDNYRRFGALTGLPLLTEPELAGHWHHGWRIALAYFGDRQVDGRPLTDWARGNSVEMVTRGINPAMLGIEDRRAKTAKALAILFAPEPEDVAALQRALAAAGFDPGPIDGIHGRRTAAAIREAMRALGCSRAELMECLASRVAPPE